MKTYNLSEDKIRQIARLCVQEQGTIKGVRAEASLMANLLETNSGYKKKYGDDVPMDTAIDDFKKRYKIPIAKRLLNRVKCIILRRAMTDSSNEPPVL